MRILVWIAQFLFGVALIPATLIAFFAVVLSIYNPANSRQELDETYSRVAAEIAAKKAVTHPDDTDGSSQ